PSGPRSAPCPPSVLLEQLVQGAAHPVLRCSVFELSYTPSTSPCPSLRGSTSSGHDGLAAAATSTPALLTAARTADLFGCTSANRMAEQCDDCTLYTEELYRCVWCVASRRCSPTCPTKLSRAASRRPPPPRCHRRGLCPAPRIDRCEPGRACRVRQRPRAGRVRRQSGQLGRRRRRLPDAASSVTCAAAGLQSGAGQATGPAKAFRCRLLAGPADGSDAAAGLRAGSAEDHLLGAADGLGRPAVTAVSATRVQQSGRPLVNLVLGSQLDSGSSLQCSAGGLIPSGGLPFDIDDGVGLEAVVKRRVCGSLKSAIRQQFHYKVPAGLSLVRLSDIGESGARPRAAGGAVYCVRIALDTDSRQQLGSREFKIRGPKFDTNSAACPTAAWAYILGGRCPVLSRLRLIGIVCCVRCLHQDKSKILEHRMTCSSAKCRRLVADAFANSQLNSDGTDGAPAAIPTAHAGTLPQLRGVRLPHLLPRAITRPFNVEKFRHHSERSQFGSLLAALLLEDMECFTDLLYTRLIVQLIKRKQEKQDTTRCVPPMRLGGGAAAAETGWGFLMYEQLSDKVVEQIDLSRRLEVLQPLGSDGEPWTCRVDVLDCDSIYQAKLKLLDVAYTRCKCGSRAGSRPKFLSLVGADADAHDLPLQRGAGHGHRRASQPGGGGGTGGKSKGIPSARHYHLAHSPTNGSLTLERCGRKKSKQADRSQNGQQTVPEAYLPILLSTKKKNLTDNITDLFGALFPAHEPVPPVHQIPVRPALTTLPGTHESSPETPRHIWKSNAPAAPRRNGCSSSKIADFHPKVRPTMRQCAAASEPKNEMLTKFKKQVTSSRSCSPFCRTALLASCTSEFVYKFQNE
uniref:Phorbol-ester/DAG-type domain-containing protein n=1 Tax=Macrostomum lignano TaxID=282301 RepID=A0A1I8FA15_9PLAT